MTTMLVRLAAVAAVSFALSSTAGAQAQDVGLDGCYGAGPAIVCDPNVHVGNPYRLRWTSTPVPVCAGSCQTVNVPGVGLASSGEDLAVCVTYESESLATVRCDSENED